ncbi:MAG: DUF4338 domain-containing protein [Verrucomicrobiota bacterium]|nr:DUF4338 domain-containing protein [Verrucomicrobiota bacterium]
MKLEDVEFLRSWIEAHPQWSRRRLAAELCCEWQWQNACGRAKDFAARSFLLKLESKGLLTLPAIHTKHRSSVRRRVERPEDGQPLISALGELLPIEFINVEPGSLEARRWASYLTHQHYLGLRIVGENVRYLARDRFGRDLAALLFGAPAWRCAARDKYLGWNLAQRKDGLMHIANNTRFLILPHVRVPHLASHLLGAAARRINADWHTKYGHGIEWLESFVEIDRFAGTCYKAANWQCVGVTTGRSRQDRQRTLSVPPKAVYMYRLRR